MSKSSLLVESDGVTAEKDENIMKTIKLKPQNHRLQITSLSNCVFESGHRNIHTHSSKLSLNSFIHLLCGRGRISIAFTKVNQRYTIGVATKVYV